MATTIKTSQLKNLRFNHIFFFLGAVGAVGDGNWPFYFSFQSCSFLVNSLARNRLYRDMRLTGNMINSTGEGGMGPFRCLTNCTGWWWLVFPHEIFILFKIKLKIYNTVDNSTTSIFFFFYMLSNLLKEIFLVLFQIHLNIKV